ncbi:hypothetical protein ACF0H5_000647 [Mactra antiquata]
MSDEQTYDQNAQNDEAMESQQTDSGADGTANGDGGGENDDDRKLFVGGLSWETTENHLKEYMSKYGKVESCNLKKDIETSRSRGFGFVVFEESESLDKVLAEKDHRLQGKVIDPKRANPKGKWQEPPIKKIYVGKISPSVTEDEIKEYFNSWGKVEKIEAPYDKEKDQRRNFVFVEFDSEEAANKILAHVAENPDYVHKIGNDEVEIKKATPGNRGRGRGGFFRGNDRGGRGGRGGYGGYGGGWEGYGQGYGGYGGGYGGYGDYSGYGGYGYDPNYGYGGYGGGWGGYDQGYGGYGGYGNYYGGGGGGWGGYGDQSGQQSGGYGKAPKNNRGQSNSGYRPY